MTVIASPLRLEDGLEKPLSGVYKVYHNTQLPDQLSHRNLLDAPIFATDDTVSWFSEHLNDMEQYELTVRFERLVVISDRKRFEHLLSDGTVAKFLKSSGADAIGYVPLHGDAENRQIYIPSARKAVLAIKKVREAACWSFSDVKLAVVQIPPRDIGPETRQCVLADDPVVQKAIERCAPKKSKYHTLAVLSPNALLVQYYKPFVNPLSADEILEMVKDLFRDKLKEPC